MGKRLLALLAVLIAAFAAPAHAGSRFLTRAAYGAGQPAGTPSAPAWVFGASPFRTVGSSGLFAPDATRLTEIADLYLPAQPAGFRLVFTNFNLSSATATSGQDKREQAPGNTNTIDYAVTFTSQNGSGIATPLAFSGVASAVMADGGFAISDPAANAFPGGWLRFSITTPAGGQRPRCCTASTIAALGEVRRNLAAPNPGYAGGGSIAALPLITSTSYGYMPAAVLVPWSRTPSILLLGDSITQQDDDNRYFADARGMVGGIVRALDDNGTSGRFNFGNFGHHGAKMYDFEALAPGWFGDRYALLSYIRTTLNGGQVWPFTAIWSQGLRNDYSSASALGLSASDTSETALAAMEARASGWWQFLGQTFPGVPIIQSTITPATGTDASDRTTLAGQSDNRAPLGGALGGFNDWLMTKPAPLALAVDLRSMTTVADGGLSKWPLTAWTSAGGGTLAAAVAAGASLSSTGLTVTTATAPAIGTYVVLEPSAANAELTATQITSVTNNGNGTYTVKLSGGTAAKAHAVGATVMTANSTDGTHPGSALQQAIKTPVVAVKSTIAGLR